ncbi:hypothetical protein [Pedobacter arcticus]|uniref:hypothetical protein n=1 Tax=Pedobacter arcticus TaxID=752140 RepID=UPI00030D463F|nr:hypothetical protein [Pedobacter arcticus]
MKTKRTNVQTTTKFQDEIVGDGFKTSFEYETLNGKVTGSVKAEIKKNGKTIFVNKSVDGNGQSVNGDFADELELLGVTVTEINAIIAENSEPVKKG